MSMEKFKRFLDDHKKELIATTVVAGGVVLVILRCKRRGKKTSKANGIFRAKDISIPDIRSYEPVTLQTARAFGFPCSSQAVRITALVVSNRKHGTSTMAKSLRTKPSGESSTCWSQIILTA